MEDASTFITLAGRASRLYGQRFGHTVALGPVARTVNPNMILWLCRCDCGNTHVVRSGNLKSGNTKSCGCVRSRRVEEPTYIGAHGRTRRERGKAATHPCVDCGVPARHWSLIKDASRILVEYQKGKPLRYSPEPSDYEPRCVKCHHAYDGITGRRGHG